MSYLEKLPSFSLERLLPLDKLARLLPRRDITREDVTYGALWGASVLTFGYIGYRVLLSVQEDKRLDNEKNDKELQILDSKQSIIHFLRSPSYEDPDISMALYAAIPAAESNWIPVEAAFQLLASLCNSYMAYRGHDLPKPPRAGSDNINVYDSFLRRYEELKQQYPASGENRGVHQSHWAEFCERCICDIILPKL